MDCRFTLTQILEKISNLAVEHMKNPEYLQGVLDCQRVVIEHLKIHEDIQEQLSKHTERFEQD